MNCTRCGHPRSQHDIGPVLRCRTRIGTGWDPRTATFASTAPCRCPGFRGALTAPGCCPHEYADIVEGCVHCGHVLTAEEQR